jgi:acid phosphatase type 7
MWCLVGRSFNYGNVHIVQISTEHGTPTLARTQPASDDSHVTMWAVWSPISYCCACPCVDFEPGAVQYQWLEADLAAVNRSVTPFVVLTGHRYAPL